MADDTFKPRRKKNTVDEILAAIKGSAGIKMTIATKLHVERHTVSRYIEQNPAVALAYKNEVNAIGDLVETTILKAIQDGDIETAKWYAKNKLKDRGYSERQEVTGADGKALPPLQIILQKVPE